jgi:hypothetical protein
MHLTPELKKHEAVISQICNEPSSERTLLVLTHFCSFPYILKVRGEPGQLSQCSESLQPGWPRGWSSGPGRGAIFLFSTSRLVLGPIQPLSQWVPEALPSGCKAARA